MSELIPVPTGATEVTPQRALSSKLFSLPEAQKFRWVGHSIPVHVPADFAGPWEGTNLEDTEIAPTLSGQDVRVKTWFNVSLVPGAVGVSYTSKRRGTITAAYTHFGGRAIAPSTPRITKAGTFYQIWWDNVIGNLDVGIEIRPTHLKFLKNMKGLGVEGQQLRSVVSNVSLASPIRLTQGDVEVVVRSRCWDNWERLQPARIRRKAEVTDQITDLGGGEFEIISVFTGRTATEKKPVTREEDWKTGETVFPVLMNQDITETLSDTGQDGESFSNNWYSTTLNWSGTADTVDVPGVRYQTIAVGQGDTIDADTRIVINVNEASANSGLWYGDDVDDAVAWSGSSLPINITRTTADSGTVSPSATGLLNINMVSIFQEIVNRGSWASGNDARFAAAPMTAGGDPCSFDDVSTPSGTPAIFEINFTAAGGGADVRNHIIPAYYRING